MATRKATFSITTDAYGYGEDDVRLTPTAATRPSILKAVQMTDGPGGSSSVTLYEAPYDSVELEYEYGTQLYFSTTLDDGVQRHVQGPAVVDETDAAVSSGETGDIYVDEQYVRCTIDGSPSSSYTVVVFYETAGDYRF